MKNCLIFLLGLVISCAQLELRACSYYPFGDDLRYAFFTNYQSEFPGLGRFNYSAKYYHDEFEHKPNESGLGCPNCLLWVDYCNGAVDEESVYEAVYKLKFYRVFSSENKMIRYLFQQKDYQAITYLIFAKNSELFNSYLADPWEKNNGNIGAYRDQRIQEAIHFAELTSNPQLKSRFYFLAIRMTYYNADSEKTNTLFDEHFKNSPKKDLLYYWSLYFKALGEQDPALKNYQMSQVIANVPDKSFQAMNELSKKASTADVLRIVHNDDEAADVIALQLLRKLDKALPDLKQLYALSPSNSTLGFLLLREINKMEDWILTPYYSYFRPSVENNYNVEDNINVVLNRSKKDRLYAKQVLQFVESVDLEKVKSPNLFRAARIYLLFLSQDYAKCLAEIEKSTPFFTKEFELNQLERTKALALTANQQKGKAVLHEEIQPLLLAEYKKENHKFIFALGRELEYLGNTTDAALLYAKCDYSVQWKSKNPKPVKNYYYSDYYADYFDYIDGTYSIDQTIQFVESIKTRKKTSAFDTWLLGNHIDTLSTYYDLIGTKYLRLNKLDQALVYYEKMDKNKRKSRWLDENPFYEVKHTQDFIERRDSIALTKADITKHLIKYIQKANNPAEKDRDYYSFLVATCYLNMNQHGNSWYMRRYYWSSVEHTSNLPDEKEYHGNYLAREFYLNAMKYAKSKEFKVLCLRMATRCERLRLENEYNKIPYGKQPDYYTYLETNNKYLKKLQKNYPDEFDDLSYCSSFLRYFNSRNKSTSAM